MLLSIELSGNRPSADEKLSRKRNAARLRQQACRARKRKMSLEMRASMAKASVTPSSPVDDVRKSSLPLGYYANAFLTPRTQQLNQSVTVSPPSTQRLLIEEFSLGGGAQENVYMYNQALPNPPSFPAVSPIGSSNNLREPFPRPHENFVSWEPIQAVGVANQPSLRHLSCNTHPPVKRIFIQRANQQAKANEQANRISQSSTTQEARTTLTLLYRSVEQNHRRSLSEVDRIEAVDAILSLKASQPGYTSPLSLLSTSEQSLKVNSCPPRSFADSIKPHFDTIYECRLSMDFNENKD